MSLAENKIAYPAGFSNKLASNTKLEMVEVQSVECYLQANYPQVGERKVYTQGEVNTESTQPSFIGPQMEVLSPLPSWDSQTLQIVTLLLHCCPYPFLLHPSPIPTLIWFGGAETLLKH